MLAHEWGHAIQDRAGNDDQQHRLHGAAGRLLRRRVASTTSPRTADALTLEPGDLEASLGAMLQLPRHARPVGADDPSAHGSAFDRISAFQDGFESGAEQCATYFDDPPRRWCEMPFSSEEDAQSQGGT